MLRTDEIVTPRGITGLERVKNGLCITKSILLNDSKYFFPTAVFPKSEIKNEMRRNLQGGNEIASIFSVLT
jgi:hypothetical protein